MGIFLIYRCLYFGFNINLKLKDMSELTFESVNKEIESLDLNQLESDLNQESLDITSKICQIWNKIGSIVRLISNIPLIPKKWRNALKLLISTLDSLCA